jgi:alpha-amylase/alpha-mannosidase (GH57 family)
MAAPVLDLVFLWHMHQPDYRDHSTGEFTLPWVMLHAIKDYSDMADHLERYPAIHAVVNFVPVLLEQLDDYTTQFATGHFRDPLLRLLARPDHEAMSEADRQFLLKACFRSNHTTMLAPYPHYRRLQEIYRLAEQQAGTGQAPSYLGDAYFRDLLTWYFLAWSGETQRRHHPWILALMAQGSHFSEEDRLRLRNWVGQTIAQIIPRYKALSQRGQIELSTTPQSHPLAPLLLDFKSAHDRLPEAPLPQSERYPGGEERLRTQITQGQQTHQHYFGSLPDGLWPAEGALSEATLQLLSESGVQWVASGEGVLRASLEASGLQQHRCAYQPWRLAQTQPVIFFRDDRLSDHIGFSYAKWNGSDAAHHLIAECESIRQSSPDDSHPVVSIILDGENAWEHYPYNAWHFFDALYGQLAQHKTVRTTTFSRVLSNTRSSVQELPRLCAGSWVYGTLSTWIGDAQKNRAWDLLCQAKAAYDERVRSGQLTEQALKGAQEQLLHCESSDWFWWFGDYNPADSVRSFDALFRHSLGNLYRLLQQDPPQALNRPISEGAACDAPPAEGGGTMRRAQ